MERFDRLKKLYEQKQKLVAVKKGMIFLVLLFLSFLYSCPQDQIPPDPPPDPTPGTYDPQTILFEQLKNGEYQFYTNDPAYQGSCGATYWKSGSFTETTMSSITVEVRRMGGRAELGYGILFCGQENEPGDGPVENFLALIINSEGEFVMCKKQEDMGFEELGTGWKLSHSLKQGFNVINRIKIEYTGDNIFSIAFNGADPVIIENRTFPQYTGGSYGYIASVSAAENFPGNPVDIRFRQIIPGDIGLHEKKSMEETYGYFYYPLTGER
jgi:hypothetical protein